MKTPQKKNVAINAAFLHVKEASGIAHNLKTSQVAGTEEQISDLCSALGEALSSVAVAETYQGKLHTEIAWLKEELAMARSWEAERDAFKLQRFDPGVFVYKRKGGGLTKSQLADAEPEYLLCPCCFDGRKKSILQSTPKFERRYQVHMCPECYSEFAFYYEPNGAGL